MYYQLKTNVMGLLGDDYLDRTCERDKRNKLLRSSGDNVITVSFSKLLDLFFSKNIDVHRRIIERASEREAKELYEFMGKKATIIAYCYDSYLLDIDCGKHIWYDYMFEDSRARRNILAREERKQKRIEKIETKKNTMFDLYETNKNASVGTECVCPSCGTKFTKTVWQQCFCTSKPKTQCKDYYWNKKKHLLTK